MSFLVCFLVLPRVTPFYFEDSPAQTGQYATIQCTVSRGDLPLIISWKFNDVSVRNEFGVSITAVGKRSSSLTIENTSHENAGNYTCVGENKVGSAEYTAQLIVNGNIFDRQVFLI